MATSTPKASSSAKKSGAGSSAKDTLDWRIKELRAFDVSRIQDRWDPVLESLHKSVNTALAEVLGSNSPDYRKFAIETFDATLTLDFSGRYSIEELQRSVQDNIAQAIITLDRVKALIRERSRQQPAAPAPAAPPPIPAAPPTPVVVPAPAVVAPPAVRPPEPTPIATPAPAAAPPVAPVAPAPVAVKAPVTPTSTPMPVAAPAVAPPPVVPALSPAPSPAATPAPVVVAQTPTPMPTPTATAPAAAPAAPTPVAKPQPTVASPVTLRVAIIGEHNAPARQATSDFIQQLGLQTANRQAGEGLYLDRLEGLRDLHYAVVLLPATAFDPASGQPKTVPPELLLELGFVLGNLGRSHVCFLVSGEAKIPAWQGITSLRMDDDGLWHLLLARAMKQAGLDVDLNRAV